MKKIILLLICSLLLVIGYTQSYKDSLKLYQKNYVENHQVVKADDKKHMHFFEVNDQYKVMASFERKENGEWFQMATSGRTKQIYRVYGVLKFTIADTALQLNIYQSQNLMGSDKYKNYLFLPFTDATSGEDSYESGRYIDLTMADIQNNQVIVDFNKAYNPYCAYVDGVYNCPIPPRENTLAIKIKAGEKKYGKHE